MLLLSIAFAEAVSHLLLVTLLHTLSRTRTLSQPERESYYCLPSASSWRRRLLRQGHWWWRGKRSRSGLLIFNDWPRCCRHWIEWFGLGVGFPGCSFSFFFFSTLALTLAAGRACSSLLLGLKTCCVQCDVCLSGR